VVAGDSFAAALLARGGLDEIPQSIASETAVLSVSHAGFAAGVAVCADVSIGVGIGASGTAAGRDAGFARRQVRSRPT
jgi:hypothetical protein